MMKYTIEFKVVQGGGYKMIPIVEEVRNNDSYGDQIGISYIDNALWISEDTDLEDEDVLDFIKDYFENRRAVLGFLQRIMS